MKLTKSQFEQLFEEKRLVLSFIGMSNIGKTYWSKKLQDVGFEHINCDHLIEKKLAPVLKKSGYVGIEDVSKWMGQPYDERFFANQNKYLSVEKEVMAEIFSEVKKNNCGNKIIDTTGSVIHTGEHVTEILQQYSLVSYLEASADMKEQMFQKYLEEPKPVVFGHVYHQEKGETQRQALGRCYRELFSLRSALYVEYADVVIPRATIAENMTISQFISLIKQSL